MAHSGFKVGITGVSETVAQFQKVKHLLNSEAVQDVLMPVARHIRDTAIRLVNQGPGIDTKGNRRLHLKELIFATKGRRAKGLLGGIAAELDGSGPSVISGVDLKKAPHAHLVEWGHRIVTHSGRDTGKKAPAYPYMRPAVKSGAIRMPAMVEEGLRRLLAPFSH